MKDSTVAFKFEMIVLLLNVLSITIPFTFVGENNVFNTFQQQIKEILQIIVSRSLQIHLKFYEEDISVILSTSQNSPRIGELVK